VREWTKKED